MKGLKIYIRENRLEFIVFAIIVLTTLFFRLYKIDQYMTFLGDEGRDALIIKNILVNHHLPLLGPPTSIGNMYLGPLYYYMMAISMAIVWLNPLGGAIMVALLTTATVILIFYLGRAWFGFWAGVISSALYSVSPVNVTYGHSSWNPNPASFFAMLVILGLYKIHKTGNFIWLVLVGSALAFAAQMHYLALVLIPVAGILFLVELVDRRRFRLKVHGLWLGVLGGIGSFAFLMSPLLLFDIRHNWMNFRAISTFFTNRETTVNLNIFNTLGRVFPIYTDNLIGRYMGGGMQVLSVVLGILILVPVLFIVWQKIKRKKINWPIFMVSVWLITGVLGLALYKQTIYDHYLGFINPAPYLLFGSLLLVIQVFKDKKLKTILTSLTIVLFVLVYVVNSWASPLQYEPHNQLKRTQEIAKLVIQKAADKPFNFALISEHNYDAAYQFYLDQYGHKPSVVPENKTAQLFVVCEDKECKPVGHPKYEIAAFGWTQIESEQDFQGVQVFKLVPYQAPK